MLVTQLIVILISQIQVIKKQEQVIGSLLNRIDDIDSKLQTLSHVERGVIDFGGIYGWNECGGICGYKWGTSKFSRPYTSPPLVFTSLRQWRMKIDNPYVGIEIYVESVNTTHVTVRCGKSNVVGQLDKWFVYWISLPHGL